MRRISSSPASFFGQSPRPSPSRRGLLGPLILGTLVTLPPVIGFGAPPVAAPPATTSRPAAPAASPAPLKPTEAARVLYTRGAEHIEKKEWKKAYTVLNEAWAIKRHWQIAMMLGWSEMELGKIKSAIQHLTTAASDPSYKEPPFPEKIATLLTEAKARLPSVRMKGVPSGAQLSIDDVDVGTTPATEGVAVDPGQHTITARLGPKRVSVQVTVPARRPGQRDGAVLVSLPWSAAPEPETPVTAVRSHAPAPIPAIVLGAGAAAGLVAGAVCFIRADIWRDATDGLIAEYRKAPKDVRMLAVNKSHIGDQLRYEDELRTGALVSWIGAGALAAAGVTLFLVQRPGATRVSTPAPVRARTAPRSFAEMHSLEWAPIAAPQGVGVLLQGRF